MLALLWNVDDILSPNDFSNISSFDIFFQRDDSAQKARATKDTLHERKPSDARGTGKGVINEERVRNVVETTARPKPAREAPLNGDSRPNNTDVEHPYT